jgi:hypothetical protein
MSYNHPDHGDEMTGCINLHHRKEHFVIRCLKIPVITGKESYFPVIRHGGYPGLSRDKEEITGYSSAKIFS